ncbi:MAG: glycosyltransferase [Candidatus Krumholzibacteriia bacterium]
MRLALLSDGGNVHTQRWAGYFAEQGDDVMLLTLEHPLSMPVPVRRLGPRARPAALAYSAAVPAARRVLTRFVPDLVNAHFAPNYGWMAWLLRQRPWVLSTWGSDVLVNPGLSPFHRWRARRVLRAADLVTSDAAMLTDAIHALAGETVDVLTAPMGIGRALFAEGGKAARERVILHNRNLESVYDVGTVLRGAAPVLRAHPDWRLRLAGDGSLRGELEAQAASLALGEQVRFLGRLQRDALMDELRRATVYLSASRSDSTSVSLLEAMALGAYPVLSDLPANREWIAAPPGAEYFAVGDTAGLEAALERALRMDDTARAEALAANRTVIGERAIWEDNMGAVRARFLAMAAAVHR